MTCVGGAKDHKHITVFRWPLARRWIEVSMVAWTHSNLLDLTNNQVPGQRHSTCEGVNELGKLSQFNFTHRLDNKRVCT